MNRILITEDAARLFDLEISDLAPDGVLSEEDFQSFMKKVTGMKLIDYCEWRYPDCSSEQLKIAIKILNK